MQWSPAVRPRRSCAELDLVAEPNEDEEGDVAPEEECYAFVQVPRMPSVVQLTPWPPNDEGWPTEWTEANQVAGWMKPYRSLS